MSHKLQDGLLNQFAERVVRVLHVQVMDKFRDDFRVRFTLKLVATFFEELFDVLIVCDDSIMHYNKSVVKIRSLRMRISFTWRSVSCPTGVRNA